MCRKCGVIRTPLARNPYFVSEHYTKLSFGLPRSGMKLLSHSGMHDGISEGSARSLALYGLGSHETQREASVTQDGE